MIKSKMKFFLKFFGVFSLLLVVVIVLGGALWGPDLRMFSLSRLEFGSPDKVGCFEKHLQEALVVNQGRQETYKNLLEKAGHKNLLSTSERVSQTLIWSEKLSLFTASQYFDFHSQPFQKNGINIVCEDFIKLDETTIEEAKLWESPPNLEQFQSPEVKSKLEAWSQLADRLEFVQLSDLVGDELIPYLKNKQFNCMYRHILESLLRIVNKATDYKEQAQEAGVSSPEWLSRDLAWVHIFALPFAVDLDEIAAPLQAKGLSIICHDVPEIPPR